MGGRCDGVFNALLGFDILSSVLRELLGAVSRLSSTSTKLSSFSSSGKTEQHHNHCGQVRAGPVP